MTRTFLGSGFTTIVWEGIGRAGTRDPVTDYQVGSVLRLEEVSAAGVVEVFVEDVFAEEDIVLSLG